ncbi:MAG: hypothetical protein EBU84_17895 [Actinobacteria bacterium]|nr:hypothetical protein [Actinomycetota bacterium]
MYFITVNKSDRVVVDYRVDMSVPSYWTVETLCAAVAFDKSLSVDDLETLAFDEQPQSEPGNFDGVLTPLMHCLDAASGLVKNNPAYVPPVVVRYWGLSDIRPALTLSERVKWDNDKTDSIKTAKLEFIDRKTKAEATEILQFLVDSGDISAASMQKILA